MKTAGDAKDAEESKVFELSRVYPMFLAPRIK
jgi:hypothetical protein